MLSRASSSFSWQSLLRPLLPSASSSRSYGNYGEVRARVSKYGVWGARGAGRAGYPRVTPNRTPGVDKNLQERLDDLYADKNVRRKHRKDIGLPQAAKTSDSVGGRRALAELRRAQRSDPALERAARLRTLTISVEEVQKEHVACGGVFADLQAAADLYGVYEDLFGEDVFFTPTVHLRPEFKVEDKTVVPVHRGNIVKPSEAKSAPQVHFSSDSESLWTLALTNPDGHFKDESYEYVHWLVGNIRGGDVASGQTLVDYLQPFPPYGTGYHRYVFVLYKQKESLDFSTYAKASPCQDLTARSFRTRDFLGQFESSLTPAGLAFFQSDWDSSLTAFFHDVLNMKEPRYEYHFLPPYTRPWSKFFPYKKKYPFNLFLDRFRDPKEIQEEVVRKKLATCSPFEGDLAKRLKYPNAHPIDESLPQWRRREIERERLRHGYYKDMDWNKLRSDPTYS